MRRLALVVLLLLALPAAAQHGTDPQAYQVRAGFGDLAGTDRAEGEGWNVHQSLAVRHDGGNDTSVALHVPAGHTVTHRACTCPNFSGGVAGSVANYTIPAHIAAGDYFVTLTASVQGVQAVAVNLQPPAAPSTLVRVYVPDGSTLLTPNGPSESIPCAAAACRIVSFDGPVAWFSVQPTTAATAVTPVEREGNPWVFAGVGFFLGVVLWGIMVRKGWVQGRRRQHVAVAAHKEAAARESTKVLEARKRALMAALKEVEVARMQNEIDIATFETVKADLKRQTVTVLRAIEEAHAAEEAKPGSGAAAS